ncbi:hypothetical protein ACTNDZ_14030 [Selenomonas montiformis]|uniref:hypothetical protein n=1 Tax=Selenomonas montiformis TaxID=2652285 RepID=UPI003F88F701
MLLDDLLKNKFFNSNQKKRRKPLTKQDLAIGVTVGFIAVLGIGVSTFETGIIHYDNKPAPKEKTHFAEFSKQAGPVQEIESISPKRAQRSAKKPATPTLPSALPAFDGSALPSTMPNLSSRPELPQTPSENIQTFDNTIVYARHAAITDGMKNILNSGFKLVRISDSPTGREDRFTTSFEYNLSGNALEKFELMSIVKTPSLSSINTSKDALNALIEESSSVNILEDAGDYLIYDFAGSGGYQIGKITVDAQGIYILGYINLTTNNMPAMLKQYWVDKLKTL